MYNNTNTNTNTNTNNTLICNKEDMLLYSFIKNNNKAYNLTYCFKNVNPNKINMKALLSNEIYKLLEKVNPDLIEKVYILNIVNDVIVDICILLNNFAKELGIKQKFLLFRSTKSVNDLNKKIVYMIEDISLINFTTYKNYIKYLNLDTTKYELLIFNYGETIISLSNLDFNNIIDVNFDFNFQIIINDDLPLYMENLIGLMFKKIFYNLKLFIDKLDNINN